ncbi:MAG TPA: cobalamin-dependent protein, partial [Polyangiaceae bacterium]|nr:cobalamin-dependent protein [Polyangiaceae bacterium]
MKIQFIYPAFERHAQSHPELLDAVPCDEYLGGPSLAIANLAAVTPAGYEMAYCDDRVTPFSLDLDADIYALSFFTPAATRALEIGDMIRGAGKKVVAGGIFPSALPDVAQQHFDSIVIGEGEGVWQRLLEDAAAGRLAPRYQQQEPFDLATLPPPRIDLYIGAENDRFHPDDYPLQTSRGCPLRCDACVVPCVMGKKLRLVPQETILRAVQDLASHGKRAAVTEDTSFFFFSGARRHFREFLKALRDDPRPRGEKVSYIGITMPMILALDPTILADISEAGINRFYLVCGFDPITRKAFGSGDQESLDKAVEAIQRCKDNDIEPYTSLLVGNDTDDEGVFDRILS